jgi:hypothetical protein
VTCCSAGASPITREISANEASRLAIVDSGSSDVLNLVKKATQLMVFVHQEIQCVTGLRGHRAFLSNGRTEACEQIPAHHEEKQMQHPTRLRPGNKVAGQSALRFGRTGWGNF